MNLYKNMVNIVDIAIEVFYYHTNMNGLCVSCGYNVIKRKHELSKIQRKNIIFSTRLKYAEQKSFCICVDIYKIYEPDDYDQVYEVLSTIKNMNLKINIIPIKKQKDMLENPDFDQD